MRTLLLCILAIIIAGTLKAQQNAMYTQYMYNELAINPAYVGSSDVLSATALYRNQWVDIKGAPTTETFALDVPVKKLNIGLGLYACFDKIGVTNDDGFYTCYAFHIRMGMGMLSFGLQAGIQKVYIDLNSVRLDKSNDQAFASNVNTFSPNFGAGIYYHYANKYYLGVSIPQFIKKNIFSSSNVATDYQQFRQVNLEGGYVFDINPDMKFKPAALLKYVSAAPLEMDLSANVWFFDFISLGLAYRTGDSFDALIELQLTKQLRLGYSYDYTTTKLGNINSGTHELILRYDFVFDKSKILSPRYF